MLEDIQRSESELRRQFDDEVVDAAVSLTRLHGEASDAYYARVRANGLAQRGAADIHDNLDPARMAVLDRATADRLAAKYGKALVALFG